MEMRKEYNISVIISFKNYFIKVLGKLFQRLAGSRGSDP